MLTSALFLGALGTAAGNSITINAHYPKHVQLHLRGSGCGLNWDSGVKMEEFGDNSWSITVDCPAKDSDLEVKVLISDKDWMIGSNHHVDMGSNSTDIYPWFYETKGTFEIIENVYSKELKNSRDVILYFPPSYTENTLKVHENVLIMHDGQNLFDPRTSAFGAWMCQDTLDATIVGGTSAEVLVVGAYNTVDRNDEYTYVYDESEGMGGKGDLYLDWIESTLIPTVQSKYRVNIKREKLGILGSSLGGLISCYAGWTRSDVYGKAGCMSSSFWWADQDYQHNVITESCPKANADMYMDSGNGSKGERDCTQYTAEIYDYQIEECNFIAESNVFKYVQPGGEHNEASWGERFYMPIEKLYPATLV